MTTDPTELTITEAAEGLRTKRLGAVELTQAYLARIETLNPELNSLPKRSLHLACLPRGHSMTLTMARSAQKKSQ